MMSFPYLKRQQIAGRENKVVFETSTHWRSREKAQTKKIIVPIESNTEGDGVAGEES